MHPGANVGVDLCLWMGLFISIVFYFLGYGVSAYFYLSFGCLTRLVNGTDVYSAATSCSFLNGDCDAENTSCVLLLPIATPPSTGYQLTLPRPLSESFSSSQPLSEPPCKPRAIRQSSIH
jgi:hypothetical protein